MKHRNLLIGIIIAILILIGVVAISNIIFPNEIKLEDAPKINSLTELNNAEEIIIKEKFFSFGKAYDIYVKKDNKTIKIGEVRGKEIVAFRDIFTFYDIYGNVLAYEKEVFKLFKLTRSAEVYSSDKNLIGYIGEDITTNLFDPGYFFYFYDKDGDKIGYSDEKTFSIMKTNYVFNMNSTKEYIISEELSLNHTFRITSLVDNPTIPKMYALFSACIEDAIRDAEEAEARAEDSKHT